MRVDRQREVDQSTAASIWSWFFVPKLVASATVKGLREWLLKSVPLSCGAVPKELLANCPDSLEKAAAIMDMPAYEPDWHVRKNTRR